MNLQLAPRLLTQGYRRIYYKGPALFQPSVNRQFADDRPIAGRLTTEELARHEAGHACMNIVVGKQLWGVVINPETGAGNCYAVDPSRQRDANSEHKTYETICRGWQRADSRPSKSWVGDEMVCLFAGPIAQVQEYPQSSSAGWFDDIRKIDLLADIFGSEAAEFRRQQLDRAAALVSKNRDAIARVAEVLAERHTLSGDEVRGLFWSCVD